MFCRRQQMRVIGIDHAEARLGSRSQVNGIGRAQKHRGWQILIDAPDAGEDLPILRQPLESSRLDMHRNLVH